MRERIIEVYDNVDIYALYVEHPVHLFSGNVHRVDAFHIKNHRKPVDHPRTL